MANIYSKPGSPYYWLRFSHSGKRYQESTKVGLDERDAKRKAQKVADAREGEVRGSGSYSDLFERCMAAIDALPHSKNPERIRQEFARRLLSSTSRKLPLAEVFDKFKMKPLKGNPSPKQISNYLNVWTKFLKQLPPDVEYMHEVLPLHANAFMDYLWGKNLTSRTWNVYLTQLRRIFNTMADEGAVLTNPFDGIESQALETESKRPLSADQLKDLAANAKGETRTLIVIGLYTGLRLGDAAQLHSDEIDLNAGTITLVPRKTRKKSKKPVIIPIHSVLAKELAGFQKGYVLAEVAAEYQKCASDTTERIQNVFDAAKIETRVSREGGRGRQACIFGFHSLRHSFVSLCYASRVPQTAVMEMVGHNSSAVHSIYQHASEEMKSQAIAALPDVTTSTD